MFGFSTALQDLGAVAGDDINISFDFEREEAVVTRD